MHNPINFFVSAYDEQDAQYQEFFFRAEDRTNAVGLGKHTDRWAPRELVARLEQRRRELQEIVNGGSAPGPDTATSRGEEAPFIRQIKALREEESTISQFETQYYKHLFDSTAAKEQQEQLLKEQQEQATAVAAAELATADGGNSTNGKNATHPLAGVDVSPRGAAVIAESYKAQSGQDPIILRRMGYIRNIYRGAIYQKFSRNLTQIAQEFHESLADLVLDEEEKAQLEAAKASGEDGTDTTTAAAATAASTSSTPAAAAPALATTQATTTTSSKPLEPLDNGGIELFPQRECMGLAYIISRLIEEEYALLGYITAVSSGQLRETLVKKSLEKRFKLQIGKWLRIILDDVAFDTHLFGFFDTKMRRLEMENRKSGTPTTSTAGSSGRSLSFNDKVFSRQTTVEPDRMSHRDRILERSRFTDTLEQVLDIKKDELDSEDEGDEDPVGQDNSASGTTTVDDTALQSSLRPRDLLTPKFRYNYLPKYVQKNGNEFKNRVLAAVKNTPKLLSPKVLLSDDSLLISYLSHVMQREKFLRIVASWIHDLRYLWDFLEQKLEAEIHVSTDSNAIEKSRITKRQEDWRVESMNLLYSEPTGGFPVPFPIGETTLMNLRAGGEARKSQMKEYNLASVFFQHVKGAFDTHFENLWFPVGGTHIGLLRYGSLQGFHANSRMDIPDADIDLVVLLDENPLLDEQAAEYDKLRVELAKLTEEIRLETTKNAKCKTVFAMEHYKPIQFVGATEQRTGSSSTSTSSSCGASEEFEEKRRTYEEVKRKIAVLTGKMATSSDTILTSATEIHKNIHNVQWRAIYGIQFDEYAKYQETNTTSVTEILKKRHRKVTNYHAYAANRVYLLTEELAK
ncbi:unnamed protein product, partial [Amoebophrya sp. A120]|eukprot:GSA120T00022570001.1